MNHTVNDEFRIAVFTSAPGHSVYKTVAKLLEDLPKAHIHILVHSPSRAPKRLIKNQFRNLKKHGWRWIPYQSAEIISLIRTRLFAEELSPQMTGKKYTVESLLESGRVEIEKFGNINGEAAVSYLSSLSNLRLGLSLAAPILKSDTFEVPELGTLNIHKGKLPEYRGMPPAFWELRDSQSTVTLSVHYVEKGLDTGNVLATRTIPVERFSSPNGLRVSLDELGHGLIRQAVTDVLNGEGQPIQQSGIGNTNTRPTLKLESELRTSIAKKQGTYGVKWQAKSAAQYAYRISRELGEKLGFVKASVAVFCYHRVSDGFRDSVTVGVEQFDEQMAHLKKYYDVRSLRSLVEGAANEDNQPAKNSKPIVCITFDDGYLDNYSNAAPILAKYGLPATFFLSTDKISNQTPFQHDLDKLGCGLPNMTWDNVREMAEDGFDFGSHTVNHADLGSISEQNIIEELQESKQTIERELGFTEILFAYPFGRRHNLTDRGKSLVKELGYQCCCSAYGGYNTLEEWDSFDIKRIGITYNFSMPAFLAQIHGWQNA